jgi:thiopeptide-type bacteriocin biosynthesis protein
VYYKVYCGEMTADMLLEKSVAPVVEALKSRGLVRRWFFIRYADPDFHLRVRFLLSRQDALGEVLEAVHRGLRPFEEDGFIWKVQLDTYQRELERYGAGTVEEAEEFFQISSDAVVEYLVRVGPEIPRWRWGSGVLEAMLRCVGWELEKKREFAEWAHKHMAAELDPSGKVRKETDQQYRVHARTLMQYLEQEAPMEEITNAFAKRFQVVADRLLALDRAAGLEVPMRELLLSYAHMHLNRLFVTENRTQEMVVYDVMRRYYTSKAARIKAL